MQTRKTWVISTSDGEYRTIYLTLKKCKSRKEATDLLKLYIQNGISQHMTKQQFESMRVDEVKCYHHGDPIGVYVEEDDETNN